MTKAKKQVENLQEENRALKARVAELEAKLAESRSFARWLEREWEKERNTLMRIERERYHQLKALGGTV